jgi:hypothetical protein
LTEITDVSFGEHALEEAFKFYAQTPVFKNARDYYRKSDRDYGDQVYRVESVNLKTV